MKPLKNPQYGCVIGNDTRRFLLRLFNNLSWGLLLCLVNIFTNPVRVKDRKPLRANVHIVDKFFGKPQVSGNKWNDIIVHGNVIINSERNLCP